MENYGMLEGQRSHSGEKKCKGECFPQDLPLSGKLWFRSTRKDERS